MTDFQQAGEDPPAASQWAKAGHVTLRCRLNGPLVVELPPDEGGSRPAFRLIDYLGAEFVLPAGKRAIALCRCGKSAAKPFCDGSHRSAEFLAGELAGDGQC